MCVFWDVSISGIQRPHAAGLHSAFLQPLHLQLEVPLTNRRARGIRCHVASQPHRS